MFITFSPSQDNIVVDQEKLEINLKLNAARGLASLDVYLYSNQQAESLVDSKLFSGSKFENVKMVLQFSPTFARGTFVYGKFVLTDVEGKVVEYLKRYELTQDVALTLYEDLSFYSKNSDLFNAFSLTQGNPVTFYGSDSQGLADLRELSNDTVTSPYVLSHQWYSPTQCGIARVSNLNFYEVRREQVGVIFDSYVCMSYTDSLEIGDVYILKKMINSNPSYYLIRLKGFESGNQPGRYIFDLRK